MSAFGTKRTCRVALHESAFGRKADIVSKKYDLKLFLQFVGTFCESSWNSGMGL
jgi:hypothetical protein